MSAPSDHVPTAKTRPMGWRLLVSIFGGLVAMAIVATIVILIPIYLFPRAFQNVIDALDIGYALVGALLMLLLGGAVARLIAGPHLLAKWLGAITILTFLMLSKLLSLLHLQIQYDFQQGWLPLYRVSTEALTYTTGMIIFNIVINAMIWIICAYVGQAGDAFVQGLRGSEQAE